MDGKGGERCIRAEVTRVLLTSRGRGGGTMLLAVPPPVAALAGHHYYRHLPFLPSASSSSPSSSSSSTATTTSLVQPSTRFKGHPNQWGPKAGSSASPRA
ncbi:hypothetical protein E2C01_001478 [Portunus trituberculatus]|uniref:Uncharacterized protein n=1 Tax=Portunus trituberculatus TaxID=210409 RepID=A0A5B7CGR0_PORTR|nr:hypothetical protein [Portunus trituberculatus]